MDIVAIQESFVDYPEHLSVVFFTKECPWNCVNCQNKYNLVLLDPMAEVDVIDWITHSSPLYNHFVISGGEPTQYDDLLDWIKLLRIRNTNAKIKLDTNGYNSKNLKKVLPFIDAVSMDIKNSFLGNDFSLYEEVTRAKIDPKELIKSIKLVHNADLSFVEFRTTIVHEDIDPKKILDSLKSVLGCNLGHVKYTINNEVIDKLGSCKENNITCYK